jgi:aldehyde dehydrogenase
MRRRRDRGDGGYTYCAWIKGGPIMAIAESSTTYEAAGRPGSPVPLRDRYDNFIGGEWIAPTTGDYREKVTPSTGAPFCEIANSGAPDIELALDAARAAKDGWGAPLPG